MSPSTIRILPLLLFLLACTLGAASAATADVRDWSVIAVSGAVTITADDDVLDARSGARLAPPFSVRTGSDGQLVIARNEDVLTIGPGARLEIPAETQEGQGIVTRIRHAFGSVLYQVRHRLRDSFEVHTPYLVSVVKGTTFNILVTADTSTVALIEGLLHLYTPDNIYDAFLEAGQIAVKSVRDEGIRIEDQRSLSEPVSGPVRIGDEGNSLASATPDSIGAVDRLAPRLNDTTLATDSGATVDADRGAGDLSADTGEVSLQGITVEDNSLRLGGVTLAEDGLLAVVGIEESSITVGGVSVGGTALTPALGVGELSADIGGVALDVGDDLSASLAVGDTSLGFDGASIGETALTPGVDVGGIDAELGGVDVGLGGDLDVALDIGETALEFDGATLGQTALTPEVALGETALTVDDGGIGLATELDAGLIDPVELDIQVDTTPVTGAVDDVVDIVNDTTSTLSPVVETLTGGLGGLFGR